MISKSKKPSTKVTFNIKMYIDFNPNIGVFYFNLYLIKYKFVIKIPLTPPLYPKENCWDNATNSEDYLDFKFEKFTLAEYVYLLHYE
ncbi:hypothetical protein LCGC14_0659470 [marine sediment metagenome]|uniref:Uncharacterized protein n=1 Tax=marine sediment metagenome TaxID=412755 RepID=A0A0F9TFL9_9ZZZZ|nr:hypothetical protein [bacterium]